MGGRIGQDAEEWRRRRFVPAHGQDYLGGNRDYTSVGGRVPLLPRRNLSVWFTRWYDLANVDVRNIVHQFESRSLPLDVFILDMNWHKKNDWSGCSVDTNLFPYPKDIFLHPRQRPCAWRKSSTRRASATGRTSSSTCARRLAWILTILAEMAERALRSILPTHRTCLHSKTSC